MPRNVFVLTGAGISAESGLGTFRDKKGEGIWAKFDPMKLATPEAFARDPEAVLTFYDLRRRNLLNAKPNAAHFALARLEGALPERGGRLTLVTQNIDDLHERAGSARVIHMHGELLKARCGACDAVRPWLDDLSLTVCPDCGRAGRVAAACGVVRRNAARHGLDRQGVAQGRSLRRHRHLGRRLSGGGLRRRGARAMACAPARSTSRRPTTRNCSTSSAWGRRARRFRLGSRSASEADGPPGRDGRSPENSHGRLGGSNDARANGVLALAVHRRYA